ncbi:Ig domain-containing protein [Nitrosopumilus ureiphilus]|uniref:Ig domain-containing protein n=1 Tax=Nitrosopumilus ureiphilus TaxID=1470067 RepID=UPI001FE96F88|nr:Ig domain-containing protein [Nitrosopumilus ureiphilus]
MRTKLAVFATFSLFVLMVIPSYAEVIEVSMGKNFYTIDEKISFLGNESEGSVLVNVVVKDPNGKAKLLGGFSDPEGGFETIPQSVKNIFSIVGTYNATAFVYKIENGTSITLEFDGKKVFDVPDYVLQLNSIGDKTVEVEKTITFTATLADSSVTDAVFSLNNAPSGATIDPNSGKFVWTPSKSHGNIQDVFYNFDIVVNKGNQEDKEKITITVKQAYTEPKPKPKQTSPEPEPKKLEIPALFVDETKDPQSYVDRYNNEASYKKWFDDNFSEYDSIYQAVGLDEPLQIPALFVDETKDPQSYVDRYNNEASYKKWFDDNFSEYDSIYQAVGLDEPLQIPALFVDETKDPQSYVDRYNNEASYKKWFDDNFSEYDSIYQAVGLDEPKKLAPFVDPNLDPQYYIDRYNREDTYKKWFDETYPDVTIYDAVGIQEPEIDEPEFGECGEGTDLVDGLCVITDNSEGGGCLIATATYGTEMSPQVQLLREIRDNQLMNTDSGASFMAGFNQFYYSFSPTIADMERENPVFREAVKIGITPLLSSLSILSYADSESEVLGYGIGVILMNIGMYFVAPAIIILKSKKYIKI